MVESEPPRDTPPLAESPLPGFLETHVEIAPTLGVSILYSFIIISLCVEIDGWQF